MALEFLNRKADAGMKPWTKFFDTSFAQKKFAIMRVVHGCLANSGGNNGHNLKMNLGFIPKFPVRGNDTSTMMGGWAFFK